MQYILLLPYTKVLCYKVTVVLICILGTQKGGQVTKPFRSLNPQAKFCIQKSQKTEYNLSLSPPPLIQQIYFVVMFRSLLS